MVAGKRNMRSPFGSIDWSASPNLVSNQGMSIYDQGSGMEYATEGLLGYETSHKTRHYQLQTFRLADVYKAVKYASKEGCNKIAYRLHEWRSAFQAMSTKA